MARFSVVIGLLLCGLTVYGMVGSTNGKIATAFVPMMFGIPLVICGVVALNPHRRRVWMAMAAAIGACGLTGAAARASFQMGEIVQGEATNLLGLRVVAGMSLFCALFVGVYIIAALHRFGHAARRNRRAESANSDNPPPTRLASPQMQTEQVQLDRVPPADEGAQAAGTEPWAADGGASDALGRSDAMARREPAEDQNAPETERSEPETMRSEPDYSAAAAGRSVDKRGQLHRI